MNLYFRLFALLIATLFRPRLESILAPSILRFRVLPNDLDLNGHMNNSRYLTIMDLGRLDLVLRTGLMRMMLKQKSVPILAAAKIRFRRQLAPFQSYELHTRLVCWDEKWSFLEQKFVTRNGEVAAIALVKGSFYDQRQKATVPTARLLQLLDYTDPSPAMPDYVVKWQAAEDALRDAGKSA